MSSIRPARPDDADDLARLQAEYHAERYGSSGLPDFKQNFARFAHDALEAGWTAWVIEGPRGLDGAVWCHHDLDREAHQRDWVAVTRLYVDPLADDPTLSAQLITHVVAWADEHGFASVVAWPSSEQSPVFVDAGFTAHDQGAFRLDLRRSEARESPARVTDDDHRFAARAAQEAGEMLAELRHELGFADPERLRAHGDQRSHVLLSRLIQDHHPEDSLVSEEAYAGRRPEGSGRVWIVDPLDGTREFGEEGRSDWAVHVALVVDHEVVAGAVALPGRGLVLSTADPPTASPDTGRPRLLVSRTRRPEPILALAEALDAELVEMGSAGAKAMAVVLGEADIYAHAGGQYEWDSAAPVAVARSAGLHASRLDGSPLVYDQPDAWLPDLLICRRRLASSVLEAAAPTPR